jgi:hypothetical protein
MFHSVDMIADEKYLHHLFQRHALIDTATDGGHDPYTGILTYGWVIAVNECIIARGTREAQRWILDKASCIPIQQYYLDKFGWTKATFLGIDWDLQQRVLSSYDINDQRRILKFVHGWLPMNYRLHREKQSSTMRCPLCFYLEETELHLFQC